MTSGKGKRWGLTAAVIAAAFPFSPGYAPAAEIRGEIRPHHDRGRGTRTPPPTDIGIAAVPLQGQRLPAVPPRTYRLVLRNNRISPAYLMVHRGDSVTFINRDRAFHEIYSRYATQPFSLRLAKAGNPGSVRTLKFRRPGVRHIFCRMRDNMYLRVDVMDTPYIRSLTGPGRFKFRGLAPGRWRLYIITVGGAALTRDTEAFTAPPPLRIELPNGPGAPPHPGAPHDRDADIEGLFPRE